MRRYYELDVLDTLAVDSVAYKIVSYAIGLLDLLKPETRYHVLDRTLDGLRQLQSTAKEEYEAAQANLPPAAPE